MYDGWRESRLAFYDYCFCLLKWYVYCFDLVIVVNLILYPLISLYLPVLCYVPPLGTTFR